jgi:serine/threonine-protein kinase
LATESGAGQDLRTYLSEHAPVPPHRAALLVASLADQLAIAHAEGRAYRDLGPETVYVVEPGVRVDAEVVPKTDGAASADVRAAGVLLARLLGATPAGGRPEGAPAVLWRVVESCTSGDSARRPGAALLARLLRDAARDLLLEVAPGAGAGPAAGPAPQYLPDRDAPPEPPPGRRSRRTGRALLVAATALAIALAGAGVLLPAAGVHLPFPKGGLVQAAQRGIASALPSGTAGVARPTGSPADPGIGPGPASDPPSPPPEQADGAPTDGTAASAPDGAAPSPPPLPSPPAGEPTPLPGTTYRTSAFDVPRGASRPPLVHGRLIWYARSVGVSAVVSSTSPCAAAVFTGYAGRTQVAHIATAYKCGNVTVSQNLNGRTTPGGITQVIVDLYVNGTRIGRDNCLRSTGSCTRA